MAKASDLVKRANPVVRKLGPIIAGAYALIKAASDNPEVQKGIAEATSAVQHKVAALSTRQRLEQKLHAIETCADALESGLDGLSGTLAGWRSTVRTLRARAELADKGGHGKQRRRMLKDLIGEADHLLKDINKELAGLADFTKKAVDRDLRT